MKTKSSDALLELTFENRNKEYGAYELRTHYNERLLKSFGYAILFAATLFLVPFILTVILTKAKPVLVSSADIPIFITDMSYFADKPKEKITAVATKSTASDHYTVVKDAEVLPKEIESKQEVVANSNTGETDGKAVDINTEGKGESGNSSSDVIPIETVMNTAAVDTAPSFPGGEKALIKFLEKNIHFTPSALRDNISGRVYVSFVVNEKGEITNALIKKSLEESLDDEVIRVVNKMPRWSPGIYHGQAVKTAFMLPVSFTLKN